MPNRPGTIIVVSAPSGAGKTTLLDFVRKERSSMVYSISATTRKPRPHEINGVHYFFLSKEEFKKAINYNEFAEWQLVFDNYYGTPRHFIDSTIASGNTIVMDIDVYGKKKFDLIYPQAYGILILPPSLDELKTRLSKRHTETVEALALRFNTASKEIDFAQTQGKYEYTLVNNNLSVAQTEFLSIVDTLSQG